MIAAASFVNKILTEGDKGRNDYLKFLKSGSSDKPFQILKNCGVDLNSEATYTRAFKFLESWINDLNKIII
ncbi:hypothetical protein JRW51_00900 [Mycoplasma sp. SG1]|nr:hypothetical protein JRW51_00900 [Mycoplasma sp. SG1]